jgi:hypothetical protein
MPEPIPEEAVQVAARLRDKELATWADENHGAPDLVERMAHAIPVRMVKSEAVGIGSARREAISRAVLPVVENEIERARADERRKVAEEIAAALDEKAAAAMNEARNQVKAGASSVADRTSRRSGAFSDAAELARQIGDAHDPR